MGLIFDEELKKVISELSERSCLLYHACQTLDFISYLKIGGIPSRKVLEDRKLPFTQFDTDKNDRDNGVWNLVFLNLEDFGNSFARGRFCTPTTYGPITFAIKPQVLEHCSDIAVCLKSAGSLGFTRSREGLDSAGEVSRMFVHAPRTNPIKRRKWIHTTQELEEIFEDRNPSSRPEVSCNVQSGYLPMSHVAYAIVDPYKFQDLSLLDLVKEERKKFGYDFPCHSRLTSYSQAYQSIFDAVANGETSVDSILATEGIDRTLRDWLQNLKNKSYIRHQFESRYAKYLKEGTIDYLTKQVPAKTGS